jgi:fatty acid desaturase
MNVVTTPGMIALLSMPFIIEMIMRGALVNFVVLGVLLLLWTTVAEGEISAMAWLPAIIVLTWVYLIDPLPPEQRKYKPRRYQNQLSNWATYVMPKS